MRKRALICFTVALALLVGAAAASSPEKPHKASAKRAGATSPAAASSSAAAHDADPDGLVIVQDKAYTPTGPVARPTPPPAASIAGWQASAGSSAKTTLAAWSAKAGWTVQWDAPYDFPVVAMLSYGGPFETAVSSYLENYTDPARTDRPINVDVFRQNRIIHVYPKMKGPK